MSASGTISDLKNNYAYYYLIQIKVRIIYLSGQLIHVIRTKETGNDPYLIYQGEKSVRPSPGISLPFTI